MAEPLASVAVKLLRFILSFYYLFSISFRFAFRYNATFTSNNWVILVLDYITDAFFLIDYLVKLKKRSKFVVAPSPVHEDVDEDVVFEQERRSTYRAPDDSALANRPSTITDRKKQVEQFERLLAQFEIQQRADAARKAKLKKITLADKIYMWFNFILEVVMIFPFEVIAYFFGYKLYFFLRVFRVLRIWLIREYWRGVVHILEVNNLVTGASGHRVVALTVFMLVFAHLGACLFYAMALALMERETPVSNNWQTADGMTVFDHDTNTYYFTKSLRYRYVRTLYWACVTSVGVV